MKSKYFALIKKIFPTIPQESNELISDQLLSPFHLELPTDLLLQAQSIVKTLYSLREDLNYQNFVLEKLSKTAQFNPGNKSLCMSYDFHINPEGQLKLIEVNTNAAFLVMGYFLYQAHRLPLPIPDFTLDELHCNFLEEHSLNSTCELISSPQPLNIAIVDEDPAKQKLFFEFLLYQKILSQNGHRVFIADPKELLLTEQKRLIIESQPQYPIDFIYNRTTDFYLETESMQAMKTAYLKRYVTLSPNPHEYALLADKNRMIEWSLACSGLNEVQTIDSSSHSFISETQKEDLKKIQSNLLSTVLLQQSNSTHIWAHKKKYFLKPLTSFGSKGSYRGEGISHSLFNQIIDKNFLAQEFCPAPEKKFSADGFESTKLKYDLRFYAYKDRIQLVIARLYQGQVTNLKTPLGGFAPIIFHDNDKKSFSR